MYQKSRDSAVSEILNYGRFVRLFVVFTPSLNEMWQYEKKAFIPGKDAKVEADVNTIQKRYKTSFEPDDLYFVCYFFFNHIKTIERREAEGIYEQFKVTNKESVEFIELLGQLQAGTMNPKKITIESNMAPKKLSFESKEIIGYFLSGITSQFKQFMGGTDFQRIKSEVDNENKQIYKQGKSKERESFIKFFLQRLLIYIKSDPVFAGDTSRTPNKQMQYIADLLKPAGVIDYNEPPDMQVKAIRNFLRQP